MRYPTGIEHGVHAHTQKQSKCLEYDDSRPSKCLKVSYKLRFVSDNASHYRTQNEKHYDYHKFRK